MAHTPVFRLRAYILRVETGYWQIHHRHCDKCGLHGGLQGRLQEKTISQEADVKITFISETSTCSMDGNTMDDFCLTVRFNSIQQRLESSDDWQ